MGSDFEPHRRKRKGNFIFSVLLAALTAAIAFLDWMELDNLLKSTLARSTIDPFSWTVLEDAFLLVVGIAWLSIVLYTHHYYAVGARKGKLRKRFCRVTGIQILIMFVCEVLLLVESWTLNSVGGDALAILEGALGVSLVLLSRNKASSPGEATRSGHHNGM